jgi:hypothetical protein
VFVFNKAISDKFDRGQSFFLTELELSFQPWVYYAFSLFFFHISSQLVEIISTKQFAVDDFRSA